MVLVQRKRKRAKARYLATGRHKCPWCANDMESHEIGMSHCDDCYKEIGGQC